MNTMEDINLQRHVETTIKRSNYEIIKDWVVELKIFDSKFIYSIVLLMGFGLYTVSYVFLYGFYFGRESDDVMSVIQVVINPVPFNFKSLIMLGLFLVMVMISFIIILQKITDCLYKKSKFIFFDLLVLIILIICAQTAITLIFVGKYVFRLEYFGIWVFLSLGIIYLALTLSGYYIELVYGFIGSLVISLFSALLIFKLKFQIRPELYYYVFFFGWFLLAMLQVYINLRKLIMNCFLYIVAYISAIILVKINFFSFRSLLTAIIILTLQIAFNFLIIKKYLHIQRIINKFNKNKKIKFEHNKFENLLKLTIGRYKFILVPIIISAIIFYSYFLIFALGKNMSKNMLKTSYDIILYKTNALNTEPVPLIGILVSHTDNLFYISNEKKELIMIKKNSDVEIIPNNKKLLK